VVRLTHGLRCHQLVLPDRLGLPYLAPPMGPLSPALEYASAGSSTALTGMVLLKAVLGSSPGALSGALVISRAATMPGRALTRQLPDGCITVSIQDAVCCDGLCSQESLAAVRGPAMMTAASVLRL